ncbi:MAG: hypothetical protein QM490_00860 [Candidatus Gracilibacteria bacterium]
MTFDKFEHLQNIDPTPDDIKKLLVGEVKNEHLGHLSSHFEGIRKQSSNREVVSAANDILVKIENIMTLGKKEFSGEIMAATADDYNNKMAA